MTTLISKTEKDRLAQRRFRANNPTYYDKYAYKNLSEEAKALKKKRVKLYKLKNKEKEFAHNAVEVAVNNGSLIKTPCVKCGDVKSEGHHEDYSKPLEVIWLCKKHHLEIHRKK
jgi:hypothetical protein